MARINFICFLFFVLPALLIAKPVDDVFTDTWSSDVQSFVSWMSYGKQAYYYYEPEINMIRCVFNKLWNLTYNHIQKSDEEVSITYVAAPPAIKNSGNKTMEKLNQTQTGIDIRVISTNSREARGGGGGRGGLERGRLASLLGVTGERFVKDYNCTVVTGRKVDELNKNSEGEVERAMLEAILDSEPVGPLIVKLFHVMVYIIQNIIYWIRRSFVLSCIVDYIQEKFAEWIYLSI